MLWHGTPNHRTCYRVALQVVSNLLRIRNVVKEQMMVSDEKRTNEFLGAASRGDTARVRAMLQQQFSPNAADYDGGPRSARQMPLNPLKSRCIRSPCGRHDALTLVMVQMAPPTPCRPHRAAPRLRQGRPGRG